MKGLFAYIRVSTAKQGERGVSLQEQREAIERYAARHGLEVIQWFEERQTAAKRGRPVFTQMLRLLKQGRGLGIIVHKIDRSARNLKDWADLGELIDRGLQVHFANESLDLHTRGGRLSADIQAVVAADYIRNLREETRKGFYGRLKQGLYPLPAVVGYVDVGKGQPKALDPEKAPLVRRLFELYATGRYSLHRLLDEARTLGLRGRAGGPLSLNTLSRILNNPFYAGLIRIRRAGETFAGIHSPLVSQSLFDRVQAVLRGKANRKTLRHDVLFRRLFRCARCGYHLIGERQKGHVYYRCHRPTCRGVSVREAALESAVVAALTPLQFSEGESAYLTTALDTVRTNWAAEQQRHVESLTLALGKVGDRLARLTDAYLDAAVDRELFEERKTALLSERRDLEDRLGALRSGTHSTAAKLEEFLELANSAYVSYVMGFPDEKRDLLEIVTSNRTADEKSVIVTLRPPFQAIANRQKTTHGAPDRDTVRTWDELLREVVELLDYNSTPVSRAA